VTVNVVAKAGETPAEIIANVATTKNKQERKRAPALMIKVA